MKPLTIIIPIPAIIAGIVSGILYVLVYNGIVYGITAPFLPLGALAYAGLAYGRAGLSTGVALAVPFVLAFLPLPIAAMLIFMQIIPLNLCIRLLMTARFIAPLPYFIWISPVYAVSYMCMYLSLFVSMVVSSNGAFYRSMMTAIKHFFPPELLASLPQGNEGLMLMGALTLSTILMILIAIFVTHKIMRLAGEVRRPHLRFAALDYPPIMTLTMVATFLFLLLAAHGTSFIESALAGFMTVLCAYFYAGLAAIHATLHQLAGEKKKYILYLYLAGFYVYMVSFAAIALPAIVIFAIVRHLLAIRHITRERTHK